MPKPLVLPNMSKRHENKGKKRCDVRPMQAADLSKWHCESFHILRDYVGTHSKQTYWLYLNSLYSFHIVILELENLTMTGWTMVFKVVGGASPPDVGQL